MSTQDEDLHPIQLESITVRRLRVEVWTGEDVSDYEGHLKFSFQNAYSPFDDSTSTITVGVRAHVGDEEAAADKDAAPFFIEVELSGSFSVDTTRFKEMLLPKWARMNAPYLLLPYVREHVYGLASRAGIRELILPLFVQPQFRPKDD